MKSAAQLVVFLSLVVLTAAVPASGSDLSGSYVGESETTATLVLKEAPDGQITGAMFDGGMSVPLKARRQGAGFSGTVGPAGQAQSFTATTEEDRIVLTIGEETIVFKKGSPTDSAKRNPGPPPATSDAAPPTAAGKGTRHVIINGKRLSDEEVRSVELRYRIRIPDADYWYDIVLGAWGVHGSQTLGFIGPNLDLGGGQLAADASGGASNIFVNGRALHPLDLQALQQITGPIMPGRYFITAQGLAGFEGGPPLWNLAAMATQAQSSGGSWQSRLSSGISGGGTVGVFLPDGGIVSTGP